MKFQIFALAAVIALAACSGGIGSAPATGTPPAATKAVVVPLVPTSFFVGLPSVKSSSAKRAPKYVGANALSVTITLNTVNGGLPPVGLVISVTSAISVPCSPCAVAGPSVPPGSDNFTFSTYANANGTGSSLATSTGTYTIAVGSANTGNTVTLQGVPASFTLSGIPVMTAGTALATAATLTLSVLDASGAPITGIYANPVTIVDADNNGTQGSQIAVNTGEFGSSRLTTQSTDLVRLAYGGLATVPYQLTARAFGATSNTTMVTPQLAPIVYLGPLTAALPEIDLFALIGVGSTGSFTASELGLTGAPYNKQLTATGAAGCATIGAISPATGIAFTFTAVVSPIPGTCAITLSDGLGQSTSLTGTYSTSGFGII